MSSPDFMNVRFEKITIKNFKNVKSGNVDFVKTKDTDFNFGPSILGIYGQNGSGKTTFVQVVEIIKNLLMGKSLPHNVIDLISVDSSNSEIYAEFVLSDNKYEKYMVRYFVQLEKYYETVENSLFLDEAPKTIAKVAVSKEKLSVSYSNLNDKIKISMKPIIDYDYYSSSVFLPNTKFEALTNNSKTAQNDLWVSKRLSHENSKSFIFCLDSLKVFRENSRDQFTLNVIEQLVYFANVNLFVIGTRNSGLINLNAALPFNFRVQNSNRTSVGKVSIHLTSVSNISEEAYLLVNRAITSMNTVLAKIIPNLTVDCEKVGTQYEDGKQLVQVRLNSNRNGKIISMANESEGIKKLVSVLQLLIVMYNNPSTTVAIDELDSGIFEYLLGELLRIISHHAKGQLIFTSHNLRALETIDKKFVYFTTTNEENRYMRMAHVAKNSNLRDFYFHEILLGGQKEELYEETNNGAIALAFSKAGDLVE